MMFVMGVYKYEISVCIECDSVVVVGFIFYYNDCFYVGMGCDWYN